MLDRITFGEFVTVKRKQEGFSLRDFAKAIMISPSYLANIESGARPAPSLPVLNNISYALGLNYEERVCLYDLAAATKKDGTVPADIAEYIYSDKDVKVFLRKSMKLGFIGSDLLELI